MFVYSEVIPIAFNEVHSQESVDRMVALQYIPNQFSYINAAIV